MVHKDCMEEDLIPPRLFILFASADKRQYPFPFPSSLCCWKSLRLKQWREAVKLIAFIVMGGLVGRHWNTAQGRRLKVSLSSCSANNKWTPSEEAGHHWLSNGSGVLCFVLSVTSLDSSIFELWGKETKERRKKDN